MPPDIHHKLQQLKVARNIIRQHIKDIDRVLLAGCGTDDTEVLAAYSIFRCHIVGVDTAIRSNKQISKHCLLLKQDLTKLPFQDGRFDVIYCYHVLEHINNDAAALREMARVLRSGGILYIGFPNKRRMLGYIDSCKTRSWQERVRWNLKDWNDRLHRRFINQKGAHAGYYEAEFIKLAQAHFSKICPVHRQYFLKKYPRYGTAIKVLIVAKADKYLFPSNYFICQKGRAKPKKRKAHK